MNWLLIDAGNSALKWALVPATLAQWPDAGADGAVAQRRGTIAADTADMGIELARACAVDGAPAPTLVVGCAVTTAERMHAVNAALHAGGMGRAQWLGATAEFAHDGITLRNIYRDPGQLGADRWHALIGARARFARTALAVINAGTATTVDGLQADGMFCGGVIAPGIDLMRASLAQGTARLPLAAGDYVPHPDNTDDAIRTGILDAQLGLIERRVRRIREAAGTQPQVVLAGGNAMALAPLLQSQAAFGTIAHEPDLVLRGLWHRARALAASAITRPI